MHWRNNCILCGRGLQILLLAFLDKPNIGFLLSLVGEIRIIPPDARVLMLGVAVSLGLVVGGMSMNLLL